MVKEGTSEFIGQLGGAAGDGYLLGAYQCVFFYVTILLCPHSNAMMLVFISILWLKKLSHSYSNESWLEGVGAWS